MLKLLIIMSMGLFFAFGLDFFLNYFDFNLTFQLSSYKLNISFLSLNLVILPLIIILYFKKLQFLQYFLLSFLFGINIYYFNFSHFQNYKLREKNYTFESRDVFINGKVLRIISQSKNKYDTNLTNFTILATAKIQSTFLQTHISNIILKINKTKSLVLNIGDNFYTKAKISYPKTPQFFGEFNERKFCDNFKANWIAKSFYSDFSISERSEPNLKNTFNQHITNNIDKFYKGENSAFVKAFILGDQTKLEFKTKEIFSKNGTNHLFSVSGFHIGIFTFLVMVLTTFIINDKFKYLIISVILLIYTYLIGMPEAMVRSVAFILLYFYVKSQYLSVNSLNLLSFFVIILLALFPDLLLNLGMQLSLAAFSGMIIINPILVDKFKNIKSNNGILNFIKESLFITLSVSILISPIIAYNFHFFTITSFISNLLSVGILSLAVFYSFISIILIELNLYISELFAGFTSTLIYFSLIINEFIYNYDIFLIKSKNVFTISLLFSLSSIYLITSKNIKNFFFKLILSFLVFILSFSILPYFNKPVKSIYYRPQNVVVIKEYKRNKQTYNLILIEQRKFYSYYLRDLELINAINNLEGKSILLYNGDLGFELIKDIKQNFKPNINIKSHRIMLSELEFINKSLKMNKTLYNKI